MKFDIKLRPHQAQSFMDFESKKLYILSDEEYLKRFYEKNKEFHDEKFILKWKHFLDKLHQTSSLRFLYLNDDSTTWENCDKKHECSDESTSLLKMVLESDLKALKELPLVEGEVYSVKYLEELISKK